MVVLILRQRGSARLPDAVVNEIREHPYLHIVERSSKMLRVTGDYRQLQAVADRYSELVLFEERSYRANEPQDSPLFSQPAHRSRHRRG
jgi:hypothetical protein